MTTIRNQWFTELSFKKTTASQLKIKRILHSEQSDFQKIDVMETESLGKILVLDNRVNVCDHDEFIYHEVMAHVPSMIHPNPKNVLIIGGGDGGTIREFAKHPTIEKIDLVEIDKRVIEVCKKFFPQCTEKLNDPRVNILHTDGIEYVKNHPNQYDIAIVDSTDPEGFSLGLFTEDFYQDVANCLTSQGIMMAQGECPLFDEYNMQEIYSGMQKSFAVVEACKAPIGTYPGVHWCFAFASKHYRGKELWEERIPFMEELQKDLKWYNLQWHQASFVLSNLEKRVLGLK